MIEQNSYKNDILLEYNTFYKENNKHISRDEYVTKSKYKWMFQTIFGTFSDLKYAYDQQFNKELDISEDFSADRFKIVDTNTGKFLEDNEYKLEVEKVVYKKQYEIAKLRKDNNILMNQICNQENHYESIVNKINSNLKYTSLQYKNKVEVDKGTIVLHCSDWHYGEKISIGSFEYDCAIAERRINDLFDSFINQAQHYEKAFIIFNGDILEPGIHDELKQTNDIIITDAVIRISHIIIQKILDVKNCLQGDKALDVCFTVGNHGRTLAGPVYYKNKVKENWEYLLGKIVQKQLEDVINLQITVANSPTIIYNVEEVRLGIAHGDSFKSLSNIRMQSANLQESLMSTCGKFDNLLIGHFHTTKIEDILGGKIFVNGALKGPDEYSIGHNLSVAKPSQTVLQICNGQIKNINFIELE